MAGTFYTGYGSPTDCLALRQDVQERPIQVSVSRACNTMADWPAEIIRTVAHLVVKDEALGNRVLHLTALCGVCQQWRQVAREVAGSVALHFDGGDNVSGQGPKATLAKFRKSTLSHKQTALAGASRILTGYTDVTLTGECITDSILQNIAIANGATLTSIKLASTPSITDAGVIALAGSALQLKQFILEDAGTGVLGSFVPVILQCCKQLETLHIEGAEGFSWAELRQSGAWWPLLLQANAGSSPGAAEAFTAQANLLTSSSLQDNQLSGQQSHPQREQQQQQQQQQQAAGCSTNAGSLAQQGCHRRQQQHRHSISSDTSDDIAESGSETECNSVGAGSDSTSISVPAAATATLSIQLQHSSLQDGSGASACSSAARVAGVVQQHEQLAPQQQHLVQQHEHQPSGQPLRQHHQESQFAQQHGQFVLQQPQQQQQWGISSHAALRRLHVRFANIDSLQQLIERCPGLTEVQLEGPAYNIHTAALHCPNIKRVAYLVENRLELDAALYYLTGMSSLRGLELEVKGIMLSTDQLRFIGLLPLRELSLDSHAYKQQPGMPRPQFSHLDNEGVKGLVDSICNRMRTELMPLKLSLCGATALKQEAVSALLRLPILTAIDTGGCVKLTPMDRMRLVAKVKAGQGMMDNKGQNSQGLAALRPPHAHLL